MNPISRRTLLTRAAGLSSALVISPALAPLLASPAQRRFRLGACDWSLGQMARIEALAVAKEIGLDGVQVSLGTEKDNMHLRQAAVQQAYRDAARHTGLALASLAIGEMNNIPYKSDPRTIEWVRDAVDQSSGNVAVAWYDCRHDPLNRRVYFYAAVSRDGFASMTPPKNFRLNPVSSWATTAQWAHYYDYSGLVFYGGWLYPVWGDLSNGTGDNPDGTSKPDITVCPVPW